MDLGDCLVHKSSLSEKADVAGALADVAGAICNESSWTILVLAGNIRSSSPPAGFPYRFSRWRLVSVKMSVVVVEQP